MAAADAILHPSVLEGFGLTALEAAAAAKPVLLRRIPGVTSELERGGGVFPTVYDGLAIPRKLVSPEEAGRRALAWRKKCAQLPALWQPAAAEAEAASEAGLGKSAQDFSELTLAGQVEALGHEHFAEAVLEANSWLADWKRLLESGDLPPAGIRQEIPSHHAGIWAERLADLAGRRETCFRPEDSLRALEALFFASLPGTCRHPMLW
jgi:hypothetical protein